MKLCEYEAKVNMLSEQMLGTTPMIGLCQYRIDMFSPRIMNKVWPRAPTLTISLLLATLVAADVAEHVLGPRLPP